jgi:hypothetical protein
LGSALLENGLDLVLLAEILLAHVVDHQSVGRGQLLSIGLNGIGERFGELGEVENPDAAFG